MCSPRSHARHHSSCEAGARCALCSWMPWWHEQPKQAWASLLKLPKAQDSLVKQTCATSDFYETAVPNLKNNVLCIRFVKLRTELLSDSCPAWLPFPHPLKKVVKQHIDLSWKKGRLPGWKSFSLLSLKTNLSKISATNQFYFFSVESKELPFLISTLFPRHKPIRPTNFSRIYHVFILEPKNGFISVQSLSEATEWSLCSRFLKLEPPNIWRV